MKKLVTIATFQFVAEAELMQSMLVDQGLNAYLADDNLIAMDWLMSNAVGGVKLQVSAADETSARELVAAFEANRRSRRTAIEPGATVSFSCENCGARITFPEQRRGGVETCRHCGRYVDVPEPGDEFQFGDDPDNSIDAIDDDPLCDAP